MNILRQGSFYTKVNDLLQLRLPGIQKQIEQTMGGRVETAGLEIDCVLERHYWGQDTQWRIETRFDDYENGYDDQTLKPHGIGGYVMLEEVKGKQMLHCKFGQFYNTFRMGGVIAAAAEQFAYSEIEKHKVIETSLRKINIFLDSFHNKFIENINEINFQELGERID